MCLSFVQILHVSGAHVKEEKEHPATEEGGGRASCDVPCAAEPRGNLRMCQNAVLAHFERDLTLCRRTQSELSLNAQTASRARPNIL